MALQYEIVGDDASAIAALQRMGLDPEVVGALADINPEAGAALAKMGNVKLRSVRGSEGPGVPANIAVPLSAPGTLGVVDPGDPVLMRGTPNKNVKPSRLLIETSVGSLELTSFTIAGAPQFNGEGSVPGSAFSPFAIESNWEYANLQGGLSAVIEGTNRNIAASTIFGCLFGKSTQI